MQYAFSKIRITTVVTAAGAILFACMATDLSLGDSLEGNQNPCGLFIKPIKTSGADSGSINGSDSGSDNNSKNSSGKIADSSMHDDETITEQAFLTNFTHLIGLKSSTVKRLLGKPGLTSKNATDGCELNYKFLSAQGSADTSVMQQYRVVIKIENDRVENVQLIYPESDDTDLSLDCPNYNYRPDIVYRHNLYSYKLLKSEGLWTQLCGSSEDYRNIVTRHLLKLNQMDAHEKEVAVGVSCSDFNIRDFHTGIWLSEEQDGYLDLDIHLVKGHPVDVSLRISRGHIWWESNTSCIARAVERPGLYFLRYFDIFQLFRDTCRTLRILATTEPEAN